MTVSTVILTRNEAENIQQCLQALKWCDDIWIVDSGSTDATIAIAQQCGAHVVSHAWLGFAEQRNFALDSLPLKHEWVLHLDADEQVTAAFAGELVEIANGTRGTGDIVAYEVPFTMLFMGRWLRHGSAYPNPQVRFGKKGALRFIQVGHGQREKLTYGRIGQMEECLYHFNFSKGIGSWISKHVTYARDEATQLQSHVSEEISFAEGLGTFTRLRRRLKFWAGRLPCRPVFRFLYMYIFRLGFMDGRAGLHYCLLVSIYDYFISLYMREDRNGKDSLDVGKLPKG